MRVEPTWGRAALVSAYADLAVFLSCEAMLLSPPPGTSHEKVQFSRALRDDDYRVCRVRIFNGERFATVQLVGRPPGRGELQGNGRYQQRADQVPDKG